MRTSSAKAKGRRLQDWVKTQLTTMLGLPKDTDLIRTAIMGESGADVQLTSVVRDKFPYSIECKNQEKFKGIYTIMTQAEDHVKDLQPLVFLKMNDKKPLVVIDAEHFLEVYFGGRKEHSSTNIQGS